MTPAGFGKNSESTAFNHAFEKEAGKGDAKVPKIIWAVGRLSVHLRGSTNSENS
jgi:hypothetical protein